MTPFVHTRPVNEVHSNDNQIFDNVDYQLSQEMHQEEHLDSDAETEIDDNTIPYHQYLLDTEAQNVPTEVSADTSDKVSMIAILTDLQTQLDGHAKVNQEKCLEIETLKNELLQCKQEICRLDTHKVKLDLENKVRQEQALVIQRNKRNAELVQENDLLKSTLSGKEKSIAFLQSEKEKILSEKKKLADSYLDEIVCLKTANKVARDMLQRFNMPTQTIPMLSKKPKKATNDLHKDILGTRNPGLGYMAKRAQPVLYDADTLLHPNHHPVSIWDSEEVLVHQVVSMKKMNEKPGHVRPAAHHSKIPYICMLNSGNVGRNNRRAYVQGEVVEGMNATNETANVQRIVRTPTPGNTSTGQCYNCGGKGHYARNCPKPRVHDSKYFMEQMLLAKQDEAGVILTDEQNDFLFADASRMEEIEELSANICLMARIQPADQNSDDEPSYESAFVSEVQSSSINENDEQINIQFDSVKGNVNSGSVEKDTYVYDQCALETLARNAYAEAAKQQRFAQKVQQQNMTLTSQIEMYKERNRVLENITKDNNYLKEFLEADERAKRVQKQADSQLYRDRDIIRDLEKQRDELSQEVKHFKQKNEELQQSHLILKRKMSENEDKYHDTILDLEEKLKKNVDMFLKIGNSLQAMFMLGPKPLSVYDQQLKHGLGYPNPYTLRQAISECPKLYVASRTVKPLLNELLDYFDGFQNLFQRDIKEMKDAFELNDVYLDENERRNDLLKDQLLEASLKHDIELCVLLNHECVDESLHDELEQVKKKSLEIQEGLKARIKILEKAVQRCEKQSVDFKIQKLEDENVSLDFKCEKTKSRDSPVKISVLDDSKNEAKKEAVYVRKNKQTDNTFAKVMSNKENVIVDCCCCKCILQRKLSMRIPKSSETTFVAPKTRFSKKATQSKTLDTTSVASKSKIDEASASKARDKVSSAFKKKESNMRDKPLSAFMLNKIQTSRVWQKWFESQPNVMWTPVNTKPHANTNPSNTKPLVSVKRWIVKLPSCPCVGSSCVAGDDLLTGGRDSNFYTISVSDMAASSPICLMFKATSTKSWLRHRRLFTWVYFLRSKDETPEIIKKFIAQAQLNYKAKVCKIRTDNGTEFKNATLKAYYEKLGIMQQFSIVRTPQQNGVVERRNRTLVEAARTMLIFSRLPEFLWAEAVATACFTQNRSIINTRHNKTPYELLRGRKPNVEYFHVFGSLCYPTNDRDDLGKMKPKADIGVFIGYSETSRGFRIYNRRTKRIMETINVKFDELTGMASEHDCLEPELQRFNNPNSSDDLMNTPSKEDLDNLFGPMFEDYFEQKSSDSSINSAAQLTHDQEDSPSTSSIIIDTHEAPPVVTTSDEPYISQSHYIEISLSSNGVKTAFSWSFEEEVYVSHLKGILILISKSRLHVEKSSKRLKQHSCMILHKFANLMKNNFEMSMMGELKFFLGLQVHQSPVHIHKSVTICNRVVKRNIVEDDIVPMSTPMATERLDADLQGTPTD
ncbi:retrovirus-related pol polyprotein from transposon TNT 1-94 [Tanacetum coccineum]